VSSLFFKYQQLQDMEDEGELDATMSAVPKLGGGSATRGNRAGSMVTGESGAGGALLASDREQGVLKAKREAEAMHRTTKLRQIFRSMKKPGQLSVNQR
jgi:hypothetical protein